MRADRSPPWSSVCVCAMCAHDQVHADAWRERAHDHARCCCVCEWHMQVDISTHSLRGIWNYADVRTRVSRIHIFTCRPHRNTHAGMQIQCVWFTAHAYKNESALCGGDAHTVIKSYHRLEKCVCGFVSIQYMRFNRSLSAEHHQQQQQGSARTRAQKKSINHPSHLSAHSQSKEHMRGVYRVHDDRNRYGCKHRHYHIHTLTIAVTVKMYANERRLRQECSSLHMARWPPQHYINNKPTLKLSASLLWW